MILPTSRPERLRAWAGPIDAECFKAYNDLYGHSVRVETAIVLGEGIFE